MGRTIEERLQSGECIEEIMIEAIRNSSWEKGWATNFKTDFLLNYSNKINFNYKNEKGKTMLHYLSHFLAQKNDNDEVIDLITTILFQESVNVNIKDNDGMTPLLIASKYKLYRIMGLLVDYHKTDVSVLDNTKKTALILALDKTRVLVDDKKKTKVNDYVLKRLISKNRELVNIADEDFRTPIMYAISNNNFEAVKLLVESGAMLDSQDKDGNTALMYAIKNGNPDIIQYLIQQNAELNSLNNEDESPLILAIKMNRYDILDELLASQQIIPNFRNLKLKNALEFAIEKDDRISITKLLNRAPTLLAEFNPATQKSVFIMMCEPGKEKILELSLKTVKEGNYKIDSKLMEEALDVACEKGYYDIAKILIEKGANIKGTDQNIPLINACNNGHYDIMELLLKAGAEVDCIDKDGNTPLILATQKLTTEEIYIKPYEDIKKDLITIEGKIATSRQKIKTLTNKSDIDKETQIMNENINKIQTLKIINLLLSNGANINIGNKEKKSAADIYVKKSDKDYDQLISITNQLECISQNEKKIISILDKAISDMWVEIRSKTVVAKATMRARLTAIEANKTEFSAKLKEVRELQKNNINQITVMKRDLSMLIKKQYEAGRLKEAKEKEMAEKAVESKTGQDFEDLKKKQDEFSKSEELRKSKAFELKQLEIKALDDYNKNIEVVKRYMGSIYEQITKLNVALNHRADDIELVNRSLDKNTTRNLTVEIPVIQNTTLIERDIELQEQQVIGLI